MDAMLTMLPLRRGIISRATRCRQKKTPLALTRMMRSQSASVRSMMWARRVTPALFTRMSTRSKVATARSTIRSMAPRSPTSASRARLLGPAAPTASAAAWASAPSMSTATTCAPAWARAMATARPMPFPAPVTMATRSARIMRSPRSLRGRCHRDDGDTVRRGSCAPRSNYAEGGYGPGEALEGQWAERFQGNQVLHGARHALGEEDLGVARLPAEPRGEIGHRADGSVVPAPLEADGADGRIALRDADAHAEIIALLAPGCVEVKGALPHGQGHADGPLRRVGHGHGVVEEDHHAVPREALECPVVLEDEPPHLRVVLAQHAHDLLGIGRLREGGEAAQVEEHNGHLDAVAGQRIGRPTCQDQLRELRREEALEPPQPLHLAHLLGHALLQGAIPLRELARLARLAVAQALLLQAGADAGAEEHGIERLGQVVLGPQLDAADHAPHLVEGGDHKHGQFAARGIVLEPPQHLVAVDARHHHVEEDQLDGRCQCSAQHLEGDVAVGGGVHGVAVTNKAARQQIAIALVVVDHEEDAETRRLAATRATVGPRRGDIRGGAHRREEP